MKFIEDFSLSKLANQLAHEGPECSVHTRIEAYSCKAIKRDKKLFKNLESTYKDELTNSAPPPKWVTMDTESEMTPFGPFDNHSSRKTLYLLIATLNIAFPDYEFSDVRPSHFAKEKNGASVLNSLSTTLVAPHRAGMKAPRTYSAYPPTSNDFFPMSVPSSTSPYDRIIQSPYAPPAIISGTHPTLYKILNDSIGLEECEVYSYSPPIESDPHADDFSEDEEEVFSGDEDSSTEEEELAFEFDDYDVDEPGSTSPVFAARKQPSFDIPSHNISRHRGALLWSSHWFFLNRKMKRILFVSIWSKSRGIGRSWIDDMVFDHVSEQKSSHSERFLGWEGGIGAGARAMGLKVVASA